MNPHLTGPEDTIEFRGGVPIPRLDLGVFRAGGETRTAVQAAPEALSD